MSTLPTVPNIDAALLQQLRIGHSAEQQLWLSGYLYGLATSDQVVPVLETPPAGGQKVLILFGSHTGNSKKVATAAAKRLHEVGLITTVADMAEYAVKNLKSETILLVVVSTQGEGEPPASAEDFYQGLMGPRAPRLENLQFAVCALGDKSYVQYCQTGKDIDNRLETLGATRFFDRMDCDAEYETEADNWMDQMVAVLSSRQPKQASTSVKPTEVKSKLVSKHDRKHPYEALVWEKIQLNGRGSEKETWHLELSLEGSGLEYAPGDALGVFAQNDKALVEEVLKSARFSGSEKVDWQGQSWQLVDLLEQKLELTVLTRDVLVKYPNTDLNALIEDPFALKNYLWGNDVADLLNEFPADFDPQQLVGFLRAMPPRLYSIASSPLAHEGEVHLTVAAVRYKNKGRKRRGVASTHIADRLEKGSSINVFVENNEFFKLPADDAADIIMVGPGTGVAPFRGFVAERAERGASGK
ncbi:MAG: flavodoxin domain-containing protein, partial [Saprospiraceae bacterium]|nr:flavodoxin domain-containing protein [Saprospiraceae bacterium]